MTFHTSNLTIDLSAPLVLSSVLISLSADDDMTLLRFVVEYGARYKERKYFEQQARKQMRV
jgi:hypothetical protein